MQHTNNNTHIPQFLKILTLFGGFIYIRVFEL